MRHFLIALAACIFSVGSMPAQAHEYHEFDPLDPALRGFLIQILEDARAEDKFRGEFENRSSVTEELQLVLETNTEEDRQWLREADYPELIHGQIGRLPLGVIMQFFRDLTDFAHTFENHGMAEFTGDDSAEVHFQRLKNLSDTYWGGL